FLEQLFEQPGGVELLVDRRWAAVAHRRLPERFFFLRGERGGGAAGLLSGSFAGGGPPRPPRRPPPPLAPPPLEPPPPPTPASAGLSVRIDLPLDVPSACTGAGGGPICRLIRYCCPIVHRFVVIQYTSSPAG